MRKTVIRLLLCTFLLGVNGMSNVQAAESSRTTTVGYTADNSNVNISIKGEEQVIKGTAHHVYEAIYEKQPTSVVWSIKGATSADTRIDESGSLIVGVDERADEIEIIAYSTIDPSKSATQKVKLIEKTYTIVEIEKKKDITVPYGTTETQIKKQLDKNESFKVTIKTNDGKTYVIEVDQAVYYSIQDVVQPDGILKEGEFQVVYDLIMPYLTINFDDTIKFDYEKDTNVIGETTTDVTVTVLEKIVDAQKPTQKPTQNPENPNRPSKPISSPATGDRTNTAGYLIGMVGMLSLMLFMYMRWKKEDENSEEKK